MLEERELIDKAKALILEQVDKYETVTFRELERALEEAGLIITPKDEDESIAIHAGKNMRVVVWDTRNILLAKAWSELTRAKIIGPLLTTELTYAMESDGTIPNPAVYPVVPQGTSLSKLLTATEPKPDNEPTYWQPVLVCKYELAEAAATSS